jgi:uncharacterized membrane protein YedE/YeeE
MTTPTPRRFLSPLAVGFGLGVTLYASLLLTGHGVGAYGFFRDLTASLAARARPFWTEENAYLPTFLYQDGPLSTWIAWEVAGVAVGALVGSLAARRFRFTVERGPGISSTARLAFALLGGSLTGLGAALARGCTSGLGLSGAAVLCAGAFVFLVAFFIAGMLAAFLLKRLWR